MTRITNFKVLGYTLAFILISHALFAEDVPLSDVVFKFKAKYPNFTVGLEEDGTSPIINAREHLLASLGDPTQLADFARLISDTSTFRCILGDKFIVFLPQKGSLLDQKVAVEGLSSPSSSFTVWKHTHFLNFQDVFLTNPVSTFGSSVTGNVSVQDGSHPCFELLNKMAHQLKSTFWVASHFNFGPPVIVSGFVSSNAPTPTPDPAPKPVKVVKLLSVTFD